MSAIASQINGVSIVDICLGTVEETLQQRSRIYSITTGSLI